MGLTSRLRYNPSILSDDSFLTNERSFCLAMFLSFFEHYMEMAFLPSIKGWFLVCALGAAGMMFGEFFRKGALYCAKHNFTHQIEDRAKRKEHRLIKVRHIQCLAWVPCLGVSAPPPFISMRGRVYSCAMLYQTMGGHVHSFVPSATS